MKMNTGAEAVVKRLKEQELTLVTAESCTGGLIGKLLTDVPGASAVYKGGVISYVNEIKHRLLGVEQEILDVCTAVSRETAHEMARGARERLAADCAVSVTGLAGPDGDGTGRPVGLVYIAVDTAGFSFCKELHLSGDRAKIREQAADAVFLLRPAVAPAALLPGLAMENGSVTDKAYMAITAGTMTQQMAAQYKINATEGVFVYSVEDGGAGDKAGLKLGDVITKLNDTQITSMEDLSAAKKGFKAGDTVTLTVLRDGQEITTQLTFDAQPQTTDDTTDSSQSSDNGYNNDSNGYNGNGYSDLYDYFFGRH